MELALALGAFVVSHVMIARTGVKPWLVTRLGERAYLGLYSLLSVVLLGWVIVALLRTPRIELWPAPEWATWFAIVVSLPAFLLASIGIVSPNPFSVSFRKESFDPERPGIVGLIRHPIVWGFGLWGLAHVPANGDLAALALFAGTVVFAVIGIRVLDARAKREALEARLGALTGRRLHVDRRAAIGALVGAVAWAAMLHLHPLLFGADPLAALGAF